ncbi:MAG: ABC transporter permease [Acidimicrobiales bacterium]
MSWRDAIALAVKTVRRRPGRALLTVLAVTLAASLLTALLTISTTAETRVLDQLSSGGPLAGIKVAAAEPDPGQVDQDDAQPGAPKNLDDDARQRIADLPDVREVIPIVSTRMFVITPARDKDGKRIGPFMEDVVGVDLTRINQLPVTLTAGRLPVAGSTSEVAVTQGYLERLGLARLDAPQVLGTQLAMASGQVVADRTQNRVRGRWTKVTIVGVVAQEASNGQFLASTETVQQARDWAAAGVDASSALDLPTSPYTGLFVVARGIDNVSKVRAQITAIGYSTAAPENLLASVRRYLRVVEIVLSAVGIIALVVAALGISNAMLAAVRERRREIGVLKAIGARDRDVYRVFLVEAATLGFLGGVFGTALGWLIAAMVGRVVNGYLAAQRLVGVQLTLPWMVVVGGIVGSTMLALVAGTLPAVRAARLPAREAVSGT